MRALLLRSPGAPIDPLIGRSPWSIWQTKRVRHAACAVRPRGGTCDNSSHGGRSFRVSGEVRARYCEGARAPRCDGVRVGPPMDARSEEHTSELQSHSDL